jgi:hypothetical protein
MQTHYEIGVLALTPVDVSNGTHGDIHVDAPNGNVVYMQSRARGDHVFLAFKLPPLYRCTCFALASGWYVGLARIAILLIRGSHPSLSARASQSCDAPMYFLVAVTILDAFICIISV